MAAMQQVHMRMDDQDYQINNKRKLDQAYIDEEVPNKKQKLEYPIEKILAFKDNRYLVKYKGLSYKQTEWITKEDILLQERGTAMLSRFHKKYVYSDGYFNPDYVQVDRILDKQQFYVLVKWKSLPYTEVTWEHENEVPKEKIEEYYNRNTIPKVKEISIRRPAPKLFTKLKLPLKYKNGNELREYQIEGLNWLRYCWYNNRSSILADEMGLGKTVQTITMLDYLRKTYFMRPFLIIAPLSTIEHWRREIERWTDMNCVIFHGSAEARDIIEQYEFYYKTKKRRKEIKFDILVTTYETAIIEAKRLGQIHWKYLAVDEGHRLKNKNSKLLQSLNTFQTDHKLLLTGTPIQNDLGELFTLLNFLDPITFPSEDSFLRKYGDLKNAQQVEQLHREIQPYLLRRMKEDVEKDIPIKEEIIVQIVPTKVQKMYYKAILERNRGFLQKGLKTKSELPSLLNILMQQRKVLNHPFLITGAREVLCAGMTEQQAKEFLIHSSSKMVLVDKLLKKLRENKHKVLIFSQFVMLLDIMEEYLQYRSYPYCRIDGTIRGAVRQQEIDRFNDPNQDNFVMLASTRAGGLGINLTAADTVIIYDSDYNPQNDLQAQARCHRIGQTKNVKVYRLLTKNTMEKELFERASKKLGLDKVVLSVNNEDSKKADANEIELLLRYGAYATFNDDEQEEKMLLEDSIDSILKRTSSVVKVGQAEQGSHFSKASFCIEDTDKSVNINDEDFWNKILPKQPTAEELLHSLDKIETEEQKNEFFSNLEFLVEESIEAFERYKYQDNTHLELVLLKIQKSNVFDEQRKALASEFLNQIQRTRERSPPKTKLQDVDMEDLDQSPIDSEYTIEKQRKRESVLGWYKTDKVRFWRAFQNYGWGKWKEIQNELKNKNVYEIQSFAENLFVRVMESLDDKEDKQFMQKFLKSQKQRYRYSLKNCENLNVEPQGTLLPCQEFTVKFPHDASKKVNVEIIEVTKSLKNADKKVYWRVRDFTVVGEEISCIAPGYTGTFLVKCVCGNKRYLSEEFSVQGSHPLLEDNEWIMRVTRALKKWIKKERFIQLISHMLEHFKDNMNTIIENLDIKRPVPWWDTEADLDLLKGVIKHGISKYDEILQDSEFCFKTKATGAYPSTSVLENRVTKLVESLLKIKSVGTDVKQLTEQDYLVAANKVTEEWSKKEQVDVQKTVLRWGTCPDEKGKPQWDIFRTKMPATLKKTDAQLESFIKQLIAKCKKIATKSQADEDIGPTTAKQLLERTRILKRLSKYVYPNLERYKTRFTEVKKYGSGLPLKWESGVHDVELLEGLKEHGFQITKIFTDPKFSFDKIRKSQKKSPFPTEAVCINRLDDIADLCKSISKKEKKQAKFKIENLL